jgi:sugar phosphate isomerase/epimerase
MKIAYAFRRSTVYPFVNNGYGAWILPNEPALGSFFKKIREVGYDGIELGYEVFGGDDATESSVKELKKVLDDGGAPCVAIRAGGVLSTPMEGPKNLQKLLKSAEIAGWLNVGVVNTALSGPSRNRILGENTPGKPIQQGSSQLASYGDFERTAECLGKAGDVAGESGSIITVEVHQHSIADNSKSTIDLLEMIDSDHVFANPDLGNILWHYDEPEESCEEAIVALASRSRYWHCKSLQRVHIPEIDRSFFIRVPLPDGDIDYRFAINAMLDAGYDGYLALEGTNTGDHISKDARSVRYIKSILSELGS